jgi:hypothetical protein
MRLDESALIKDFIAVDGQITGREAVERAGAAAYLIIQLTRGRYAVFAAKDLRSILSSWKKWDDPLDTLNEAVLEPRLTASVQLSADNPADQARLDSLKEGEFLVVLAGTRVAGLYTRQQQVRRAIGKEPGEIDLGMPSGGGGAAPPISAEKRYINTELRDAQNQLHDPRVKALLLGQVYNLSFDIDTQLRSTAIARSGAEFRYQYRSGEESVTLTVRLETDDFILHTNQEQPLVVPRSGKSLGQASFLIEPKGTGERLVNAVFLKDGNFIQVLTLKFTAGDLFQSQSLGRDIQAAFWTLPRDVSLTILNTGTAFLMILVTPGTGATAMLPLRQPDLADIADQARRKLMEIIDFQQDGAYIYQHNLVIPPEVNQVAIQNLAEAGLRLYQRIFFGPAADEQCKNLGIKLRDLAQKEKLKIQIFSQDFVFPWAILYLADRFDPDHIDPELFLGFKHIIEHIPLQQSMQVTDNRIDSQTGLKIGLNVNTDIDQALGYPLVGGQVGYWEAVKKDNTTLAVVTRTTRQQVTGALSDPTNQDQVLYFYCHGAAGEAGKKGGIDASVLWFSGNGRLTKEDLEVYAPTMEALPGKPLVFINACESAKLSPLIYDGFVPYFMAKGARGVIGAECEIPALFAVEWARRFFDRFLRGDALGQIFLDLRREFYFENNNLLGLLYALYVDGDTRVEPSLNVEHISP